MALNLNNTTLRISAGFIRQFPTDAIPQIAMSGRSNVGKSSLINTLLGRKSLARVSASPGKTITINFYDIDKKLFLVDLPGYGFAKRPKEDKEKWSSLTDGYFTANPNIDLLRLVVQLVDSRIGFTDDDLMMRDYLGKVGIPYVIVMTKTDKLNKTERAASVAAIKAKAGGAPVIQFSSHTGEGRTELWREILRAANINERF